MLTKARDFTTGYIIYSQIKEKGEDVKLSLRVAVASVLVIHTFYTLSGKNLAMKQETVSYLKQVP